MKMKLNRIKKDVLKSDWGLIHLLLPRYRWEPSFTPTRKVRWRSSVELVEGEFLFMSFKDVLVDLAARQEGLVYLVVYQDSIHFASGTTLFRRYPVVGLKFGWPLRHINRFYHARLHATDIRCGFGSQSERQTTVLMNYASIWVAMLKDFLPSCIRGPIPEDTWRRRDICAKLKP